MLEVGAKIGRFVIVRELGAGGMGAVYAAHDPQLDRQVALKIMRDATGEEEDRVRMLREGQAMAKVTHPNVITVYEVGTDGGIVFLAQELLDAGTLAQWLEHPHAHTYDQIIEKFLAAGRGLAAAHAVGLVHRDFKPENVLLGKDGRVRVADFGLARTAGAIDVAATNPGGGPPRHGDAVTQGPMNALTRTGTIMGTPMFMAPEQHEGKRADARSDQFGFCVALYHALYGTWPYEGKTAPALADAVIAGRLEPRPKTPKVAGVPPRIYEVLRRGLATRPRERYPSIHALLVDLEPRPVRRSRLPIVLGVVAAIAALGSGAWAFMQSQQQDRSQHDAAVAPMDSPRATAGDTDLAALTKALDLGKLDEAIRAYDAAADAEHTAGRDAQAALIEARTVYLLVQRGDLKGATDKLRLASEHAGSDVDARAHVDLATGALAEGHGELGLARSRSEACGTHFKEIAPILAALCQQLLGETAADGGDFAAARSAFETGLALAKQEASAERTSSLRLSLAGLDLDEHQVARAASTASSLRSECGERGAVGCEVHARILLARVKLHDDNDDAAAQKALEILDDVKFESIQSFRVRLMHQIALGEVHGQLETTGEDGVEGLDRIEKARKDAYERGFAGLVLEARLARSRVMLVLDTSGAREAHAALVAEAKKRGFERIASNADAFLKGLGSEPSGTLPADGGLPAVRPDAP